MLKKIDHRNMGRSQLGWLDSHFHFSFAEYYNPDNLSFGTLRVINDDIIQSHTGFDTHPHRDMEIVTYVVQGELTHQDSMQNSRILKRGEVQYMSAGTGVFHSEYNHGEEELRLLQIWILPDAKGYPPYYGDHRFAWEDRENTWLWLVAEEAPISLHQDINIAALALEQGKEISYIVKENRQAYLVQIEGESKSNGISMVARDGLEIIEEEILIQAKTDSHLLLLEMKKVVL